MFDGQQRQVSYLRISLLSSCNLACSYCKPRAESYFARDVLDRDLLLRVVRILAQRGIRKLRLSGGEPLLYPDVAGLVAELVATPGIEEVVMTTNATLLADKAYALREAGLSRLNISLDTVDPKLYTQMSGRDNLAHVLAGIDAASAAGFENTKLNAVLVGGQSATAENICALRDFAEEHALYLRFIELMRMGVCASWPGERFVSADCVLDYLSTYEYMGIDGVAEQYVSPAYKQPIGLIRPISHKFCATCNRLRLTADGTIKNCLHSATELSLVGKSDAEIEATVSEALRIKPKTHHIDATHASDALRSMDKIGG